jgi:hypothetical protein
VNAVTIGVDPGGRFAGIVAIHRDDTLERALVLDRRRLELKALEEWVWHVELVVVDLADELNVATIGIEGVKAPSPHARRRDGNALTNVTGIVDTAAVYGGVITRFRNVAVTIPPGGHGSHPQAAYPEGIRKGTRGLGGPPEHARSAFDVARAARLIARHPRLRSNTA